MLYIVLTISILIGQEPWPPASADYTCLDFDYSGYHKNLIQLLFINKYILKNKYGCIYQLKTHLCHLRFTKNSPKRKFSVYPIAELTLRDLPSFSRDLDFITRSTIKSSTLIPFVLLTHEWRIVLLILSCAFGPCN